ncbi:hypothetical protein [Rhodococcus sp. SG20037]|uniref:hypothetical protein n=1 Tax=Rhodococcus sp. SG20037 TaxID=3074148 RepID=UPI00287F407D|nr:hypothetical protein [Rhodococcus sp. SG20037]WNF44418.1 hypothetical protein RHP72_13865 [Rhodococcus sp. SG20037]
MNSPSAWVCDKCSDDVTVEKGLVAARRDSHGLLQDWRIVHNGDCAPAENAGYTFSVELERMVGQDGLSHLLSFLSAGPLQVQDPASPSPSEEIGNFDAYVDIFRRLQTPFYEKARRRFEDPEVQEQFYEANSARTYEVANLESIAKGLH